MIPNGLQMHITPGFDLDPTHHRRWTETLHNTSRELTEIMISQHRHTVESLTDKLDQLTQHLNAADCQTIQSDVTKTRKPKRPVSATGQDRTDHKRSRKQGPCETSTSTSHTKTRARKT